MPAITFAKRTMGTKGVDNTGTSILGGAGAGAALGATAGSVVPGIGTAIGGAVGGVAGALGGLLSGQANKTEDTEGQNVAQNVAPQSEDNALNRRLEDLQRQDRVGKLHDALIASNDLPPEQRQAYQPVFMKGLMHEIDDHMGRA